MALNYFNIFAFFAIGILAALTFVVLFEPGLAYRIDVPLPAPDTDDFFRLLGAVVDEPALDVANYDVLTDGAAFYSAELEAIRNATASIHLEAYIFHVTPIGKRFLDALTERAAQGIQVRVVVDAVGSMLTPNRFFDGLRAAGGRAVWYHPFRWYTLKRLNNRTHRELLVIDGLTGFIGGAGIATAWWEGEKGQRPWRDTMLRVDGPIAAALQTVFIENWLEGTGEILAGEGIFPACNRYQPPTSVGQKLSLVVASTPSAGRATRARILFQMLVAAARTSICVNSPYFLPDRAMRRELLRATRRGVQVTVIVPGKHNNHPMARRASRRHYGELLAGGVIIHEYEPGMIHAKIMIVDAIWSVIGSTNFDNRSFGLNDEVNLAVMDNDMATRLATDFALDLRSSRRVDFSEWARRPVTERLLALAGILIERHE
ncbi:MAG: phospholipase D/Transphosphatidylase [Noviherbaspirillum sp.]|nr:phospholipase D/Transphosphatidylase [Noviherbaspirillum sp.]MDB5794993.1 phospholipase D/Transphosphatidylase [Noviherbaspirillum sp.]